MQKASESVKATLRPAARAISIASLHRRARFLRIPQIAFEIEDRGVPDLLLVERRRRQILGGAEEGVHRPLRVGRDQDQAARGRHVAVAGRGGELDADRRGCRGAKTSPSWSSATWPMKPARPPSMAMPATVFAADPPLISRAGPISLVEPRRPPRRRSAASSPWRGPRRSMKSSSAVAITSTMALPMARTSRRGLVTCWLSC